MDPNPGCTLQQLWDDADISQKLTRSRCHRGGFAPNYQETAKPPQRQRQAASTGRVGADTTVCENKAVDIPERLQEGRPALF